MEKREGVREMDRKWRGKEEERGGGRREGEEMDKEKRTKENVSKGC